MISSEIFYAAFDEGFRPAMQVLPARRMKGKPSRYEVQTAAGPLQMAFKANPKASAIPHVPGEFWPVIIGPESLRGSEPGDDGSISWYQYTSEADVQEIQALRWHVYEKVAAQDTFSNEAYRGMRDSSLGLVRMSIEAPLDARLPSTALHYLDAVDARAWGGLFAAQLREWLARFEAAPETLDRYMWRVHWTNG